MPHSPPRINAWERIEDARVVLDYVRCFTCVPGFENKLPEYEDIQKLVFPRKTIVKDYLRHCAPIMYIHRRSCEQPRHHAVKQLYALIAGLFYEKNNFPRDSSLREYCKTDSIYTYTPSSRLSKIGIEKPGDIELASDGLKFVVNLRFCIVFSVWNYFLEDFMLSQRRQNIQAESEFIADYNLGNLPDSSKIFCHDPPGSDIYSYNRLILSTLDHLSNAIGSSTIPLQDIINLQLLDSNRKQRKMQPLCKNLIASLAAHNATNQNLSPYDICIHLDALFICRVPRRLKSIALDAYLPGLWLPEETLTLIFSFIMAPNVVASSSDALVAIKLYEMFTSNCKRDFYAGPRINFSARRFLKLTSRFNIFDGNEILPKLRDHPKLKELPLVAAFLKRIRSFFEEDAPYLFLDVATFQQFIYSEDGKLALGTSRRRYRACKILKGFEHVHLVCNTTENSWLNSGFDLHNCQELMNSLWNTKELTIIGDLANYVLNNNDAYHEEKKYFNLCAYIFDKIYSLEILHIRPNCECCDVDDEDSQYESDDEIRFVDIDPLFCNLSNLKHVTIRHDHPQQYKFVRSANGVKTVLDNSNLVVVTGSTDHTNYKNVFKSLDTICSCGVLPKNMQRISIRRKKF